MIDPPRLREGVSEVPPELGELFRDAKKPEPLTPATDARLLAQITALNASAATPVKGWLVVGGAIVVAGATALVLVAQRSRAPSGAPSLAPAHSVPASVSGSASAAIDAVPSAAASQPESTRTPVVSAGRVGPAEAASSSEDALAGEAKLLNLAHVAMATDPRKALALAGEHAKRYPRGQLAAERELIAVQALVELGRVREAEARGRALRNSAPSGIYGGRLDTILERK